MKYIFLIWTIVVMLPAGCKHNDGNKQTGTQTAPAGWAGNKDVVCNMKVSPEVEDTLRYEGKLYGFCSKDCLETFQKNPQEFLAAK